MALGLVCLKREVAAFKLRGSSACLKERWPSGRRRTPGTRVGGQPSRGFESHPLRHANVFVLYIHLVTPRLATVVSSLATDMFMADSARRFWSAAVV